MYSERCISCTVLPISGWMNIQRMTRWEKVRDHKTNFGYGAAATYYILPSLQAKFSYEHAYRLPESIEMFGDGLIQQRNPDLKPESSRNLNLGLSFIQTFGAHQLSADGNFIYRYTTDFILKGVSLTSNPTTGYENLGKVLTRVLRLLSDITIKICSIREPVLLIRTLPTGSDMRRRGQLLSAKVSQRILPIKSVCRTSLICLLMPMQGFVFTI